VTEMKVRGGEKSRDWRQVSMKGKERKGLASNLSDIEVRQDPSMRRSN